MLLRGSAVWSLSVADFLGEPVSAMVINVHPTRRPYLVPFRRAASALKAATSPPTAPLAMAAKFAAQFTDARSTVVFEALFGGRFARLSSEHLSHCD